MNKYLKIGFIAMILSGALLLSGEEVVEAIVAIVNDDVITLSQCRMQQEELLQMVRAQGQSGEWRKQYEKLKEDLLDTMITELLLLQEARKNNIDVAEQVRMTIENIKEENGFDTDEQLKRALQGQGIEFDVWKNQMEQNFRKQNVIFMEVNRSIAIDDTEIVNYYKQNPGEFTELPEYRLKAIYLSSENNTDEELQLKKQEIKAKIETGEDFAELASLYSEGPEKESEGDLGTFKQGELDKNLEKAIENLNPGELTSWVQAKAGWYLLRLEEKKESRLKSFEEVRKEIEEKLFNQIREKKLQEFLEKLRERSYIKILIPDPFSS